MKLSSCACVESLSSCTLPNEVHFERLCVWLYAYASVRFKTKPLFTYNLPLLSPKYTSNFKLHHKYILREFRILGISRTGRVHCFHVLFHCMEKSFLKILQNVSFLRSTEMAYRFESIYWQFSICGKIFCNIQNKPVSFCAFYYNIQQCNTAVASVRWYCLYFKTCCSLFKECWAAVFGKPSAGCLEHQMTEG